MDWGQTVTNTPIMTQQSFFTEIGASIASACEWFWSFLESIFQGLSDLFSQLGKNVDDGQMSDGEAEEFWGQLGAQARLQESPFFIKHGYSIESVTIAQHLDVNQEFIRAVLKASEIPLTVNPERPDRSYALDQKKAKLAANKLEGAQKSSFEHLVKHTQHISMQAFEKTLEECVKDLNRKIGDRKYSVGFAYGKSNQWVTSLALDTLLNLPSSHFSLGFIESMRPCIEERFDMTDVEEDVVVLFDDVGYSGSQLKENIQKVAMELGKKNTETEIYVVVPYTTKLAREAISEISAPKNVKIDFITSLKPENYVKSIADIEESYENPFKFNLEGLVLGRGVWDRSKTACYTDWNRPDQKSFIQSWGSSKIYGDNAFIADIIPRPYNLPPREKTEYFG